MPPVHIDCIRLSRWAVSDRSRFYFGLCSRLLRLGYLDVSFGIATGNITDNSGSAQELVFLIAGIRGGME